MTFRSNAISWCFPTKISRDQILHPHLQCIKKKKPSTVERCDKILKLLMMFCRYIKEGSTVSVMGVVQRNDNVLMIVPPPEPLTTGCQWAQCIFPASLEGIVLRCEDTSKIDVIPV